MEDLRRSEDVCNFLRHSEMPFSPESSLRDFCSQNFGLSVIGSVNGKDRKVFSVMGPKKNQINSLEIFSKEWSGQELQE